MLLWKLFYYSAIASTAFNPVFSFTDFTITTSTNVISCPTFTSFCDVISMLHHLIHCSLCSVQYLDNVCRCHSVFWNEGGGRKWRFGFSTAHLRKHKQFFYCGKFRFTYFLTTFSKNNLSFLSAMTSVWGGVRWMDFWLFNASRKHH